MLMRRKKTEGGDRRSEDRGHPSEIETKKAFHGVKRVRVDGKELVTFCCLVC